MRKFLASLAMLGIALVPAAAQSIGGTYTVAGTNFDGSKYGGEATITLHDPLENRRLVLRRHLHAQ